MNLNYSPCKIKFSSSSFLSLIIFVCGIVVLICVRSIARTGC